MSVPSDCECQKLRVSEYEVISVAREQLEEAVYMEDYDEDMYDDDGNLINDYDPYDEVDF